MKTTQTLAAAGAALVLAIATAATRADETTESPDALAMMKAMAAAGQPGPEHAKLEPLVGSWTYTCKVWMDPSQPPVETSGTIERRWILGGRFLEERIVGTGYDGESGFEGFGLVGYDNGQEKFISSWACNMNTGISTGQGTADASGKQITFRMEGYCPLQNKTVTSRDEIRIHSNDKTVAESYMVEEDQEVKILEIVAVRKK